MGLATWPQEQHAATGVCYLAVERATALASGEAAAVAVGETAMVCSGAAGSGAQRGSCSLGAFHASSGQVLQRLMQLYQCLSLQTSIWGKGLDATGGE